MKILILFSILSFSLSAEYAIDVSISEQRLYLINSGNIIRSYPISSSSFGEGQIENSFKTPLGEHEVKVKIGTNVPLICNVTLNSDLKWGALHII